MRFLAGNFILCFAYFNFHENHFCQLRFFSAEPKLANCSFHKTYITFIGYFKEIIHLYTGRKGLIKILPIISVPTDAIKKLTKRRNVL